jgi:DNA-binding MarR family transcriptional regulator
MKISKYLEQSPVFVLGITSDSIFRDLNARLKAEEVSFLQGLILVTVFFERPGAVGPSELSQCFQASASNVSHCLSYLESRRWVRRTLHPGDARRYQIAIRGEGEKKAARLIEIFDVLQGRFERRLSAGALKRAVDALETLRESYFGA